MPGTLVGSRPQELSSERDKMDSSPSSPRQDLFLIVGYPLAGVYLRSIMNDLEC